MDTRTFYSYAGTDRVDTLVIRLYGDFCAFAGNAGDFVYRDEAVVYLGNFELEKTAQEIFRCAGNDNLGIVVFVIYL